MEKSDNRHERVPESFYDLEVRFAKGLHGNGIVGQAFRSLCVKGADPKRLQTDRFKLRQYPQERVEKRYKAKDLLKLKAVAAKLKKAANELEPFEDLLFEESFAGLNFRREFLDWERPTEIPDTLRRLSNRLQECADSAKSSGASFPNIYKRIPRIVECVRAATGRPHYDQMSTLIGFALGKRSFSTEELKMICFRRKSKTHGK